MHIDRLFESSSILRELHLRQFQRYYQDHFRIILVAVFAVIMLFTFLRSYPVDDAFITYRYAQNLVDGHGPVWNPGERVEGYSNFLWLLMIAFGMLLGLQPEVFIIVVNIPIHLLGLILTYSLSKRLLKSRNWALFITIWVGFNSSVSAFATSGMETSLQMLLFLAVAFVISSAVEHGWNARIMIALSTLLALALLTRPDSMILAAASAAAFLHSRDRIKPADVVLLSAPILILVFPWLVWKVSYYGSLLSNPVHTKVRGFESIGYGLFYLYLFTISHMLLPFLVLTAWRGKWIFRTNKPVGYIALFVLIWMAYVAVVGGDFMEFRFLIAVIPFMLIAIVYVLKASISNRKIAIALAAALFLGNINAGFGLGTTLFGYGIESVRDLTGHLRNPRQDWIRIGKRLNEMFKGTDVIIAVGAAGAIPYYSELPSVDFIGLCDPVIPEIAEPFTIVPGHRIIAPFEYIVDRKVNLIIEPNNFLMRKETYEYWRRTVTWGDLGRLYLDLNQPVHGEYINKITLLAIPIRSDSYLIAFYLTPHPEVDRVINEYDLDKIPVYRR